MMSSAKSPKHSEANQDLISNLPSIATDKILSRLPLHMAAKMSVLSKKWKENWLTQRHLVFDEEFWVGQGYNEDVGQRVSNIISNILFHHNGPLHKFCLFYPAEVNLNQWLHFLSRSRLKKMALINWFHSTRIPSHIFFFRELVKLRLEYFVLSTPPSGFKGFASLRSLELVDIEFKHDMFRSLISSCPRLAVLKLLKWTGMDHVIIDVPSLESLVIKGIFKSVHLKNVVRLNNISLGVITSCPLGTKIVVLDSIKALASSSELQYLQFGGHLCKFLAAGGITELLPVAFNHLDKLSLIELDLGCLTVFGFVLGMVHSCPCIKELEISVKPNKKDIQHKLYCDDNYKLSHLRKVQITGITGSIAELKFIEYMLAVSVMLEKLFFKCGKLDADSELTVSRDLLQLPRASPKAQLVWLKQ